MAERRMFAKKITESDAFLDMPLSTQALYFHLCMCAEDKGILNNVYSVCRSLECEHACINELLSKKFLLKIDDEHFRITHWYENNGIGETHKKRNSYSYRKWRKAVIERDKVCMKCGCKNNLEAHHIKPFAKYPELALDLRNGITLCKKCHMKSIFIHLPFYEGQPSAKPNKPTMPLNDMIKAIQTIIEKANDKNREF